MLHTIVRCQFLIATAKMTGEIQLVAIDSTSTFHALHSYRTPCISLNHCKYINGYRAFRQVFTTFIAWV